MNDKSLRLKMKYRVLIADDDALCARPLANFVSRFGFEVKVVRSISEAKEKILFWKPQTVFVNLLLPETNALALVRFISGTHTEKKPFVAVMSKQAVPETVDQLRKAGADHYLLKPFAFEEALGIVLENSGQVKRRKFVEIPELQLPPTPRPPEVPETPPRQARVQELHLLGLFLKQAMLEVHPERSLFNLMRMINMKVKGLRCSLIRCINEDSAYVMASNDDENAHGIPLDLSQYPEVKAVWKRHRALVIPDVKLADILATVQARMTQTPFETMVLFPVYCRGQFYGVLSLRMEKKTDEEISYIEKFGHVCSRILSLSITTN